MTMSQRLRLLTWLAGTLVTLASCGTYVEEKRVRELLVEDGFGQRSNGVATLENYVTGGDGVVFFLEPTMLIQPGYEQLALLTQPQQVGIDGTIHLPYVGNLMILGLTERELEDLIEEQLQALYAQRVEVDARILNLGKAIYIFGEGLRQGRVPLAKGDFTLLEAIATAGTSRLANIGRITVIRPDAKHPLVLEVNFREMVLTGNTTYNVLLQDNDIIYIPPTLLGAFTRFVQKILQPITLSTRTLLGIDRADRAIERSGFFTF